MAQPGQLKILEGSPRTLQRWDWNRSGQLVNLTGMILFLSTVPRNDLWLAVELFDPKRKPLAAAAVQLLVIDHEGWGTTTIETEMETPVEPPYRLRVRYMGKKMHLLTDRVLTPDEPEVRPWNQRQLLSSSSDYLPSPKDQEVRPWNQRQLLPSSADYLPSPNDSEIKPWNHRELPSSS